MYCHRNGLYLPLIFAMVLGKFSIFNLIYEYMNGPLTRKLVILPYIAVMPEQVEIVTFRQKAIEAPSIDKEDNQPLLKQIDVKFKIYKHTI